ncbi:hypothetical protein VTO42DRAFT_7650 [Malbranchea cinnamomea]
MSAHPNCVLCGAAILRSVPAVSWQHKFRAVRKRNGQQSRPFLTGIGRGSNIHSQPDLAAPSDPDKSSYDHSYTLTSEDMFLALNGNRFRPDPGFPFHEACWQLLRAMMHPREVPVESLYYIFYSLPINSRNWVDWGHSYGGLVSQRPTDYYPWEQRRISGLVTRVLGMSKLSPLSCSTQDPLDIPELRQALEGDWQGEVNEDEGAISYAFWKQKDCFAELPVEICEEILIQLSSRDVVNLRMASRSFARISLSEYFWKSRFSPGFEREYIFEARLFDPGTGATQCGWKALYHRTNLNVVPSRGLANRRRIWESCRSLVDVLKSEPLDATEPTGLEDTGEWPWRGVSGDAAPISQVFWYPSAACRVFKERAVRLPSEILEMLVSTVTFCHKVYITGLQIVAQGQPNTALGYIVPGRERVLNLRGDGGKPGVVTGFITAVDASGIRGFRVTLLDGRVSEWVGQSDEIPKTLRLCTDKPITHLHAAFDGFKMVQLSIPGKHLNVEDRAPHLPLRTTALWYPDIPPENHSLHDSSFAGKALPLTQYRPLIRVMFGGPNGSYLKYLTKISVTVSKGFVAGLDFEYNAPGSPVDRMRACRSTSTADDSVKIPFSIDGPGGEILTSMEVRGNFWPPSSIGQYSGAVTALSVSTNRHRKFTFEPSAIPRVGLPAGPSLPGRPGKIEFKPGTTITGVYVMHDNNIGMVSLSPVSEVLSA